METKLSLSVILPLKSAVVKDFDEYFDKCIKSLKIQKTPFNELVIVHTMEEQLIKKLESYDFESLNVKMVPFEGKPNYQSQINLGIENVSSDWVSFFEFDDEYSSIWFRNVKKYIKSFPNVQGFLPVVVDVDDKGLFVGYTNEATFAASFNVEIGILTNELLNEYQNFQSSGMVFKKSLISDFGGLKSNMKLTFVYEFLLRLTYNSVRIMTIPKIGYKHINLREDSIFWNYKNGNEVMSENEVRFWIDTAKKEFFFKNKRDINYVES